MAFIDIVIQKEYPKAMGYSKQIQKVNREAAKRIANYAYHLQQLVWSVKHSEDQKLINSYLDELQTTIDTISDIYRKEVC